MSMQALRRAHRALCAVLLVGCATGPTYEQVRSTLPAPAPGVGRVFVFRRTAPTAPSFFPEITIDGAVVQSLRPNSFFFADVPAGAHRIGVHVRRSDAPFGLQGSTAPVDAVVEAGAAAYVQADLWKSASMVIVTLTPVSAADAETRLAPLHHRALQPAGPGE